LVKNLQKVWESAELQTVKMSPVTQKDNPSDEAFWGSTPSGSIELCCVFPETVEKFPLGSAVFVDFSPAE